MNDYPVKLRKIYDEVTLTAAFAASGDVIDVVDNSETTIYIEYTPGTSLDSIQYQLEFTYDGTNWFPEPDEVVAAGVATVIPKSRTFVSLDGTKQFVPVLSMPVADKQARLLVKETISVGHGTVTVNTRTQRLK